MIQRILNAQAMTAGEAVFEPADGASTVSGELWRQTHGGVTLYALAAYAALRSRFHENLKAFLRWRYAFLGVSQGQSAMIRASDANIIRSCRMIP